MGRKQWENNIEKQAWLGSIGHGSNKYTLKGGMRSWKSRCSFVLWNLVELTCGKGCWWITLPLICLWVQQSCSSIQPQTRLTQCLHFTLKAPCAYFHLVPILGPSLKQKNLIRLPTRIVLVCKGDHALGNSQPVGNGINAAPSVLQENNLESILTSSREAPVERSLHCPQHWP